GGAGVVTVNVAAPVSVFDVDTLAAVKDGATVNASTANAGSSQSVHVKAAEDFSHMGLSGALGVAGTAGVTPAATVTVVDLDTEARIGSAVVNARRDVV